MDEHAVRRCVPSFSESLFCMTHSALVTFRPPRSRLVSSFAPVLVDLCHRQVHRISTSSPVCWPMRRAFPRVALRRFGGFIEQLRRTEVEKSLSSDMCMWTSHHGRKFEQTLPPWREISRQAPVRCRNDEEGCGCQKGKTGHQTHDKALSRQAPVPATGRMAETRSSGNYASPSGKAAH